MKRVIVDANVIVRFLLDDHPRHSPAARDLLKRAESGDVTLVLTDLAVAEIVWVLTSFYEIPRTDVSDKLLSLIGQPGLSMENRKTVEDALQRYRTHAIDYIDCYHAAVAARRNMSVISFDKDFRHFEDIEWKQT